MSRLTTSLRVLPVLLLLPLLLGLMGFRPASVQAQGGGARHRIYLPWTLQSHSLIGAEALAITGDRAYLGYGSHVITYDISRPGDVRQLAQSEAVDGHIVRIATGSDRLFTLSRPDFTYRSGTPPDLVPWSVLTAFDLGDPNRPRRMASISWTQPNLYVIDLVTRGHQAYLAVRASDPKDRGSVMPQCCSAGILSVDASQQPLREHWLDETRGMVIFRTVVQGHHLYAYAIDVGTGAPDNEQEFTGLVRYDLSEPGHLKHSDSTSHGMWMGSSMTLTASESRIFQLVKSDSDEALLLTTELDSAGRPSFHRHVGTPDRDYIDRLPSLFEYDLTDRALVWHMAWSRDHLYILDSLLGQIHSVDVGTPLSARHVGSLPLSSEAIEIGDKPSENAWGKWALGDTASALVADPGSDRLFLASGQHGALVEIDASDPHDLTVTGIYPASDP